MSKKRPEVELGEKLNQLFDAAEPVFQRLGAVVEKASEQANGRHEERRRELIDKRERIEARLDRGWRR